MSRNRQVVGWAGGLGIPNHERFEALHSADAGDCDYLLSITNLRILPAWLLQKSRLGAINFHDGPLPRHAGLNAPVWALINGETSYGVTWHEIAAGIDQGRILVQREFPVTDAESSLGLNAQCYQAGLESFAELVAQLEQGSLKPRDQDQSQRTYHGLADRPAAAATLDWSRPAAELARLTRALDFGRYPNPVMLPKVNLGGSLLLAREARVLAPRPGARPGEILGLDATSLTVACGDGALEIVRLTDATGADADVRAVLGAQGLRQGSMLPALVHDADLDARVRQAARHEGWWHEQLSALELPDLPFSQRESNGNAAGVHLDRVLLESGQTAGESEGAHRLAPVAGVKAQQPDRRCHRLCSGFHAGGRHVMGAVFRAARSTSGELRG